MGRRLDRGRIASRPHSSTLSRYALPVRGVQPHTQSPHADHRKARDAYEPYALASNAGDFEAFLSSIEALVALPFVVSIPTPVHHGMYVTASSKHTPTPTYINLQQAATLPYMPRTTSVRAASRGTSLAISRKAICA